MTSSLFGASGAAICKGVEGDNSGEILDPHSGAEDADTRIKSNSACSQRVGNEHIVVLSGVTKVFFLLMHFWNILHSGELRGICLRACVKGKKNTKIK